MKNDIILTVQELRNLTERNGFSDETVYIDADAYIKMLRADGSEEKGKFRRWRHVVNTYTEATFNKRVVVFDWLAHAKSWRLNRNYEKARSCVGHARRNRLENSRHFNRIPK